MIAYAVYIISMSGLPLVSEKFQSADSIPNETLLAGLFTAIQGVASELTQSEVSSININKLSYHFKSFGQYQIVLVTNFTETPGNVIQKLGLQFMKDYGEILTEDPPAKQVFEPFIETINEIVREELIIDDTRMINPTKKFSPAELYNLPDDLRAIAVAMITLKEGNVEQIAKESNNNIKETETHLKNLQSMGFIGKKRTGEIDIYFCSI